jgi:hypothetical protein
MMLWFERHIRSVFVPSRPSVLLAAARQEPQQAQSRQTKIPSGGYLAWGCFIKNLIINHNNSLIFLVLASRIL